MLGIGPIFIVINGKILNKHSGLSGHNAFCLANFMFCFAPIYFANIVQRLGP